MSNALKNETSPYLLQHADNPVDWRPWNDEALALARDRNKPILLSIGYSACHWCHVMAHESFEDEETAALMNELFVNIKVDREERPDLDRIYQLSQQLFSGRPGGWPLTVFLTPEEQMPIFAGTYFPKTASHGLPSFKDVLNRVESYFRSHRTEIDRNAERLVEALDQLAATEADTGLTPGPGFASSARARLGESFDAANGGFGTQPKFPHPAELGLVLRSAVTGDTGAARIVKTSLNAMARGGLYDHLGGGFFRYCVDGEWRIPHFEKMLYDNASLLGLYSEAFAASGDPLYERTARETADWLLRDMRDANGGFYATLDADSEGEEGKFYLFTRESFADLLTPEELVVAAPYFGLNRPANFEGESWHLQPREAKAPTGDEQALLETARAKLLAARESRPRPGRDEKELTSWNGLAIASLARAARYLERDDLGNAALAAVDFIRTELWVDGRLKAVYKDHRARFAAYLDDYAFLLAGLIELMQWRFRSADLDFACELADCLLEHFRDPSGGFFFTADDHERLINRPKPMADEAVPSGNGLAALSLDSLGHLLGKPAYLGAAKSTVDASLASLERHPEAHTSLLRALERQLEPPELVIVRGSEPDLAEWRQKVDRGFTPGRLCFFIDDTIADLPGLLGTREPRTAITAYVCSGTECLAPIDDLEALLETLGPPASL